MPAYKYTLKSGKTLWYANFYYTDWTGEKKHICKRGFKTQREAKDYERSFLDQQSSSSDILFSSTTNARTIIWHQFCFLLFFKLLKVLLDTELGVS